MRNFLLGFLIFLFGAADVNAQWVKQSVNTNASLRGLSVVSDKVVWASGTGGTFLKTVDGGKTWKVGTVPGAEKLDFRDVEAFDANTAYVLSIGNGEDSRIYKTIDGGGTWSLQFKNTNAMAFYDAIACWDKKNCIAMSDPVDGKFVLIATNGGDTWKPLDTFKMPLAKDGEAAFAASGTCLITHGKKAIFLVTGGIDARVFRSPDRGKTWFVADTPIVKGTPGSGIFSIAMRDSKNGVIVGGNYEKPDEKRNTIAFTADGGKTWKPGKNDLNGYRSGVAFVNDAGGNNFLTIDAVGSTGWDHGSPDGPDWKVMDTGNYNSVQRIGDVAWAVGANGIVVKSTVVRLSH